MVSKIEPCKIPDFFSPEKESIQIITCIENQDYNDFLKISCDYIIENWSKIIAHQTINDFQINYRKKIEERFKQGNRGLFLYKLGQENIGIANAYIEENKDKLHDIYIAEFFIQSKYRHKGFGKKLLKFVLDWGLTNHAVNIIVEVDKDLLLANKFWSSFKFKLDSTSNRNIYFSDIKNLLTSIT